MLFTERGRGGLLVKPGPLSGSQIEAEIKVFLLMYRLFLYYSWFFQNIEKGWRKIFEKKKIPRFHKNEEIKKKKPLAFSNLLKKPLLVEKQTIHQQKDLDFSFNLTP